MVKIMLSSNKYPGISFVVPEIPLSDPPKAGSAYFAVGTEYEVSEATKESIVQQMSKAPVHVSRNLKLSVSAPPAGVAIADPPKPPAMQPEPELVEEEIPVADDITELSEDDIDLINVEVGKLLGKTIAEAEPQLIKTGSNIELPRTLRSLYLDEVIAHDDIQKRLKETAAQLKEQI